MRNYHALLRSALLGSSIALVAVAPALASSPSHEQWKRMRALHGVHPAQRNATNGLGASGADPTYTVLHDFAGGPGDGAGPSANVTLDDAGNIYSTTDFGGANGDGAVFKLATDGTVTLLHSFTGADGAAPDGGVLVMPNGTIFGTTGSGGSQNNGVLFKISAKGKYKVLHDFVGNDGSFLRGDLVRDKLGNLYGTALFGGSTFDGTVYEYAPDGTFTVLHTFNGSDGEFPEHGVVRDRDGNLYGVTAFGGASDEGTVYKIAADGTFSTVYNFTGGADGGFLYGGLDLDNAGNIYGTTASGGSNGAGTVFKLTPDGTLTTIYNFTGAADGGSPEGDTLQVGDHIYGAGTNGGDPTCQCGVVYDVDMSTGQESVLHAFAGGADGGGYSAGVVNHAHVLYGTTSSYGANNNGVLFSLTKD